jgi:subtilisin family serine protease
VVHTNKSIVPLIVAGLVTAITCSYAEKSGRGFLLGGISSGGASAPKEGDIKLQDQQGHWYLVQGIPENPPPYTDKSVTVAIIDSGVLVDHPQLKGLIAEQRDFTGEGVADRIGHGTLVTIIALAPLAALPPEERAKIPSFRFIVAKVANADGSIDKDAVIYAINWAVERGAKVVNLSLGFREGTDDFSGLCDIIAKSANTFFAAAAGNFGPNVRVYPAACKADNLMAVGASNPDGSIAAYSGHGDVAAPGTVILVPSNRRP